MNDRPSLLATLRRSGPADTSGWQGRLLPRIATSVLVILGVVAAGLLAFHPIVKNELLEGKQDVVRQLTYAACSLLELYEAKVHSGEMTRAEAQNAAKEMLRNVRYGPENKDYFWITDTRPRMIMHPYRRDLEGVELTEFMDTTGTRLFLDFVDTARTHGEGYASYSWQWKDDPRRIGKKISFVKKFTPWGWVVGTGFYPEEMARAVAMQRGWLIASCIIGIGVVAVLGGYLLRLGHATDRLIRRERHTHRVLEHAVQESTHRMRAVFDNSLLFIALLGPDGTLLECNHSIMSHAPAQQKPTSGTRLWEAAWWQHSARERLHLREAVQKAAAGEIATLVTTVPAPNGTVRYLNFSITPVRDDSHYVTTLVAQGHDITAAKLAEESTRKAEERYRSMFENSIAGIFQSTPDGRLLHANPAMASIMGYDSPDAMLLSRGNDISHHFYYDPEDRHKIMRTLQEKGQVKDVEVRFLRKDGSQVWVSLSCWLVRSDTGTTYVEGTMEDRTERAIKDQAIKDREAAEAANLAKSEFLARMSHEIRTPMNAIMGMSELLWETELTPDQKDYVQTFRSSGTLLLEIINDILDFSKIEAGLVTLESIVFSVRDEVETVARLLAFRAHEKNLELVCHVARDVPSHVVGDPARLRQVLINLMGNAIKFTHRGDVTLHVSAVPGEPQEQRLLFAVSDTGIGIALEQQQAIFQRFSQADTSTTRRYGGTGLGLAISRHLVTLMGGAIQVVSSPGNGSRFSFHASFASAPPDAFAMPAPPPELAGVPILVVDDHDLSRRVLLDFLEDFGMDAKGSVSMVEALDMAKAAAAAAKPFRIALMANSLPDMEGFAALARMRREVPTPPIPLLLYTSTASVTEKSRARALFHARNLIKPVRRLELRDTLIEALHAPGVTPKAPATPVVAHEDNPPLKVLLVEDYAPNRQVIAMYCKHQPITLTMAENGQIGLETYRSSAFDIILMDMEMPVMDGYEATRTIRDEERATGRAPIPIIAITAHVLADYRGKAVAAGCTDYLAKPLGRDQLLRMLQKHTRTAALRADAPAENSGNAPLPLPPLPAENVVLVDKALEEIMPGYLASLGQDLHTMHAAIDTQDFDTIRKLGHNSKGVGTSYGLERISNLGRDLEHAATAQDAARVHEALDAMRAYLAVVTVKYVSM
ncbi:MAG: cache domain-containing protein [Desulfovibrionaceae bacterium]